jgi:hypothetical protein
LRPLNRQQGNEFHEGEKKRGTIAKQKTLGDMERPGCRCNGRRRFWATHPVFDLGEGSFDWIEIGPLGAQVPQLRTGNSDHATQSGRLWLPNLSMMTMSPGLRSGMSCRST